MANNKVTEVKLHIPERTHAIITWEDTGDITEVGIDDATLFQKRGDGSVKVIYVRNGEQHAEIAKRMAREHGIKLS